MDKVSTAKHRNGYKSLKRISNKRIPKHIGAVLLGLNDALVEFTGMLAGLTFALMNNRLVMLTGIIAGVSATLSMASSKYLAEKADGNPHAFKACCHTGIAYIITVALLVAPYAVLSVDQSMEALVSMLIVAILIIFSFSYYLSIVKSLPFFRKFYEMATISLGVAAIAFGIGHLAKHFIGI